MTEEVQRLVSLRDDVLSTALPLVTESNVTPLQKFTMLMSIARSNGNAEALRNAYEAACKIEENDTKVDALMTVVNEIELMLEDAEDEQLSAIDEILPLEQNQQSEN